MDVLPACKSDWHAKSLRGGKLESLQLSKSISYGNLIDPTWLARVDKAESIAGQPYGYFFCLGVEVMVDLQPSPPRLAARLPPLLVRYPRRFAATSSHCLRHPRHPAGDNGNDYVVGALRLHEVQGKTLLWADSERG